MENKIDYLEIINPGISKSAVSWHMEHSLLTMNLIIKAIESSNPNEYENKFSLAKLYVFTFRKIPRGRIQAPKRVMPTSTIVPEALKNHFKISYDSIAKLNTLQANNYFEHPFFGKLNLKPAIKFLEIHTKHHLDIINDILKTAKENKF